MSLMAPPDPTATMAARAARNQQSPMLCWLMSVITGRVGNRGWWTGTCLGLIWFS